MYLYTNYSHKESKAYTIREEMIKLRTDIYKLQIEPIPSLFHSISLHPDCLVWFHTVE